MSVKVYTFALCLASGLLNRPPRSVGEVLGTSCLPGEIVEALSGQLRTVREDGEPGGPVMHVHEDLCLPRGASGLGNDSGGEDSRERLRDTALCPIRTAG